MKDPQPIKIYLIRHAEAGKAWHEDPDPGLSRQGHAQASALAERLEPELRSETFQVWSSPLLRAQQTAQALELDIQIIPAFAEIPSPGIPLSERSTWLKGVSGKQIAELDTSLLDWRNTILRTLEGIDQNTLIFSHFMVINCVVGWITGQKALVHFHLGYCAVNNIENKGGTFKLIERGKDRKTVVQ